MTEVLKLSIKNTNNLKFYQTQLTQNELKEFCKNKIADYKQPKKIIIINELDDLNEIPKGPTKKILYRKLKEYYKRKF